MWYQPRKKQKLDKWMLQRCVLNSIMNLYFEHASKQHAGASAGYLSSLAVGRSWCCRPVTLMAWDEGRSQQRASPWPDTGPSWPALRPHTSLCTAARQSSPLATPLNIFHPAEHKDCPAQRTWDQGDECHSAGDGGWGGGWGCRLAWWYVLHRWTFGVMRTGHSASVQDLCSSTVGLGTWWHFLAASSLYFPAVSCFAHKKIIFITGTSHS